MVSAGFAYKTLAVYLKAEGYGARTYLNRVNLGQGLVTTNLPTAMVLTGMK